MPVYNYLRARWSDGCEAIDDVPPALLAAVEAWLDEQRLSGSAEWVRCATLEPHRITVVAFESRAQDEGPSGPAHELTHAIVVPERRLREPSSASLEELFASIYGSPLDRSAAEIRAALAQRSVGDAAPHVVGLFADAGRVAALPWAPFDAPADVAPAPGRGAWSFFETKPAATGLAGFLLGAFVTGAAWLSFGTSAPEAPAPPPRDAASDARFEELQRQVDELTLALRERQLARRDERAPVASAPPEPRQYSVIEWTARVRSGPSASEPTLGLLGVDATVRVRRREGDWLEIEPPPGLDPPTWIHASVVVPSDA